MGKNNQGLFQSDQVTHYKMYKKGRYWLFSGIVLATMWQGSILVQADETHPAENGTISQVAPQVTKPTGVSKVTSDSHQVSDGNVTAAIDARGQIKTAASQDDQDTSLESKPQSPSSTAPVQSETKRSDSVTESDEQSRDKATESGLKDLENGQSEAPLQEQSATPTNAVKQSSVDATKTEVQETNPIPDGQQSDEAGANGSATSQSEAPMQEQSAAPIIMEKSGLAVSGETNERSALTDANVMMTGMLKTSKASQLLRDAAEPVVTEVATGNVWGGTSQWTLNSDGELHIGAGTFGSNPEENIINLPWDEYDDKVKSVIFDGKVVAVGSLRGLFTGLANVTAFTNFDYLDTSKVTDLSYMFQQDMALKNLDLSSWDVSQVTNMDGMFNFDTGLTSLNVADWHTDNLVSATGLFRNLSSLKSLDIANWNTSKMQDATAIFSGASSLTDLDVSRWNTSSLTNAMSMFYNSGVKNLDLHKWDMHNVQKVTQMFAYTNMDTLNISGWNLGAVTDLPELFGNNPSIETYSGVVNLNASNLIFGKNITNLASMFTHLTKLKTIDISDWNMKNITELTDLFANDTALETIIADNWDLSNLKEIKSLFNGLDNLTTVSAKNWNLPQLTDLTGLFSGYQKLAKVDASGWKIDQVTSLKEMFSNLPNLTDVNVSDWKTGQVTDMSNMFANDGALPTLDLSSFDTSSATTLADMLAGTNQLSKLVLGGKTRLTMNGTNANLPDVVAAPTVYKGNTGYWINPKYDQFTSKDLLNLTDPAVLADTFVWQKNLSSLTVKDSVLNQTVPNQWQPTDNLVAGTDVNGQALLPSDVTSSGTVDTTTPNTYTVTYQYTGMGRKVTATATIKVIASKVAVTAHDTTLTQNQKWDARDSLDGALEYDGQPADQKRVVVIDDDKVDLTTPGTYTVTYQYTDVNGNRAQKRIMVTVVKSKVGISAKNATVNQGQTWFAQDSFEQAQAFDGQPVTDFDQVTVLNADKVDTKTPGTYRVTYRYTDIYGNMATKTITVTVVKSQVDISASDTKLIQGQSWSAQDSFERAQTFDGQPVTDFDQVAVTGVEKVDTKKPGAYQVTYQYSDAYGNVATKTIMVTVVMSQVGVVASDTTLIQGQKWVAEDSFDHALTFDGQAMADFTKLTVIGANKVNTKTPGIYPVTYQYTDTYGNVAKKMINITVKASQYNLSVKNVVIKQGKAWTPEDSFISATDATGQAVGLDRVTVTDANLVDTSKQGKYIVSYQYTDMFGNQVKKMVTVTVVADNDAGETPIEPDDDQDGDNDNSELPAEPGHHGDDNSNGGATAGPGNSNADNDRIDHSSTGDEKLTDSRQKQTDPITTVVADKVQNEPQSLSLTKRAPVDTAGELPKTSESTTSYAAIVGAIMIGMLGLAGFFGKRWHEKS